MSDKKNIGVVEYFNADSTSFYCGFVKIKFTSQFDYIKSRGKSFRAFIKNPCAMNFQKGEIVCFDLSENVTENNCLLEVENIRKAEVHDLLNEKFLSDKKDYLTIITILFNTSSDLFSVEIFNILVESEKYFSISWINEYLARNIEPEIYVKNFLEIYQKNPEKLCGFNSMEEFNGHVYNCILRACGEDEVAWRWEDKVALGFWKEFVLTEREVFSAEIFLALWREFDANQRFFLLQKAIKNFSDEDCENLFERFISGNADFILDGTIDFESVQKLSHCIKKSVYEVQCAEFLLNNLDLFKVVDAGDDVTLFLLYTAVKENAELDLFREIWKIFKYTKKVDTMSPKIRVAFLIFEAGCLKMANKSPKKNINKVAQIFLENFKLDPNDPEKFPDFRYIFPACDTLEILFCEAKKWYRKEKLKDGTISESIENYCPRGGYPERCAHVDANLNLPVGGWTIIELVEKFNLTGYAKRCVEHVDANLNLPVGEWTIIELVEKFNLTEDVRDVLSIQKNVGEYFNYIGAAYNRLWELRDHLKCRECGEYMKPAKPTNFKAVRNLKELIYKAHHAIFGVTTFQCKTVKCPNNDPKKQVYLSHCWHCHSLIDSRDNKVTLANPHPVIPLESEENDEQKVTDKFKFYSCTVCGAGYQDLSSEGERHAVFPGTLCPNCLKCYKCGSQNFTIIPDQDKKVCYLQCAKCGKEMIAPLTFEDNTNSEKAITRKMTCKKCGHKIEFNKNDLKYFAENYKYKDIDWARW